MAAKPFELESFLRDEAKIDDDGVKEYLQKLQKNKLDEKKLHLLTPELLKAMGVTAIMDIAAIVDAAKQRRVEQTQKST